MCRSFNGAKRRNGTGCPVMEDEGQAILRPAHANAQVAPVRELKELSPQSCDSPTPTVVAGHSSGPTTPSTASRISPDSTRAAMALWSV